jgi:hypothetical protein
MEILTDSRNPADPSDSGLHRVTFAEDCIVVATNVPKGGNMGLDLEVLSLAMERAKGAAVALSFDSDQGGESCDDYGYVPVMTNLLGGHLPFLLSSDGKMLKAPGIATWLARANGETLPRARTKPAVNGAPATDPVVPVRSAASANRRSTVANTLRNFFTADQFRQMLEFNFLPGKAVRVHEGWKAQGDLYISGHGRPAFDADCVFAGWQENRQHNCARLDVHGRLGGSSTNAPSKIPTLKATLWIDPALGFPTTTTVEAFLPSTDQATNRPQGTNSVVTKPPPKSVRQSLNITLLEATPLELPASSPP